MIAADTNVFVRYIVGDDPKQAAVARKFFSDVRDEGDIVFLSIPVLCETIWVLESSYKMPKTGIVEFLRTLLEEDSLMVESDQFVAEALK